MNNRVYKTLMGSDQDGSINICDSINYKGQLWLVPHWISKTGSKWRFPLRIVSLEGQKIQDMSGTKYPADFLLSYPVPKSVLDGQSTDGYTVIESPNLKFPIEQSLDS